MAASCFPPLPVTTTTSSTLTTTTTVRSTHQQITSSTYRSFRDVDDDEDGIAVLESIEIETVQPNLSWRERLRRSLRRRRRGKGNDAQLSTSMANANTTITMTTTLSEPRPLMTLARSQSDGHLPQVGGMSRPAKPAAQAKKVAPPAVPELYRLSGSSFGSAGYGSSGEDTSSPGIVLGPDGTPCIPNTTAIIHRDLIDSVGDPYGAGKSPSGQFSYPAFTFPGPQGGQYAKASLYHHQLSLQEDQGIDMTQSPGRDSPGSSGSGSGSRHSTASLDSGRASGFHPMAPRGSTLSSSSLGSGGEHGGSVASGPRAERLLNQGVPDQDVIHAWLMDLHFEEYFPLFASAGYDLPTICRMTPEDLTAIGIKKPNHRKKLKAEIAQLNIPDGLPDYIPGSLDEWLRLLRLEEYGPALVSQGYLTVEDVTQLTWEDLEDIGIVKLGHQKKILLAIKRVNDVRAGKRVQPPQEPQPPSPTTTLDTSSASCVYHHHQHLQQQSYYVGGGGPPLAGGWSTLDWRRQSTAHSVHPQAAAQLSHSLYGPDIVPIKIRGARGKSLESLEDPTERGLNPGALGGVPASHLTFQVPAMAPMHHPHHGLIYYPTWRPRSYDDGDLTPTNDLQNTTHVMFEGGGTLPRPRGLVRPRPIAKIPAKQRNDLLDVHSKFCPEKSSDCQTTTITVDLHSTSSSPLSLPAYPSGDELSPSEDLPLPPPPAPATPPPSSNQPPARQGSDASFKSTSSTESDSMPFANENAGTIKQRATRPHPALPGVAANAATSVSGSPGPHAASTSSPDFSPPKRGGASDLATSQKILRDSVSGSYTRDNSTTQARSSAKMPPAQEPADVLNDIGNMLANLTDELDAMLEEEKRQGLSH